MREAEVSVTTAELEEMGIEPLLSLTQEAGLQAVDELACHGTGAVIQVEVAARLNDTRLNEIDCVDQWSHVADRGNSHLYVISFTAPDLPGALSESADDLLGTCDPTLEDHRATMSFVGPHEAISTQLSEYERAGVSPDLERIGRYEGPTYPLDTLTDRQREVIETAWEMGYYEVPKQVSAEDIAAELDVDSSTINEHLQRAERNLLDQFL